MVQNIDELLEKVDNRTIYLLGAGMIGFLSYMMTDIYLQGYVPVKEVESKTGKIEAQIGESPGGWWEWKDMGEDPVTGGRKIQKVWHNG